MLLQLIKCSYSNTDINELVYQNTFSRSKWRKYTKIDNVRLEIEVQGNICIELTSFMQNGSEIISETEYSEMVMAEEQKQFRYVYPECNASDLLGVNITPLSDKISINNAVYVSDIDQNCLYDINLAIIICTYKREEYVTRNMQMLQREVFENESSPLHGHLKVYIADNGKTLQQEQFAQEYIQIYPNKNSGGSGGFSRGAIEAMHDPNYAPTHVIFMDDDIEFEISALERLYTFLSVMKEEYTDNLIGGAMFRSDQRNIQHAAGETITPDGFIFNKMGYDMTNIRDVVRNEIEEPINYLGWWFCCIPVSVLKKKGFSLPLFFQYDDIEFSLRCSEIPKITLNGICCWHIPFDKKMSGAKKYYNFRNKAIVSAIHFEKYNKTKLKKDLLKECLYRVFLHSYQEAALVLQAAEDFLKGMSWLSTQDPEKLNDRIMQLDAKYRPIDELGVSFGQNREICRRVFSDALFEKVQNWLKRKEIVLPDDASVCYVVKRKENNRGLRRILLKYDPDTKKGLIIENSLHQGFCTVVRMLRDFCLIDRKFTAAAKEYREMCHEVVTEEFWRSYLEF